MTTNFTKDNLQKDVFRFGRIHTLVLALFLCVGCTQHFHYAPEKHLTYKPVKVHEFKAVRVNKSDKKARASFTGLH
jgi:hypothetical protein